MIVGVPERARSTTLVKWRRTSLSGSTTGSARGLDCSTVTPA
ncbi:hypothetical protein ABTX81_37355 [Kitasatospora sp. NPDC097605]